MAEWGFQGGSASLAGDWGCAPEDLTLWAGGWEKPRIVRPIWELASRCYRPVGRPRTFMLLDCGDTFSAKLGEAKMNDQRIGEVVEASTNAFTAEAYALDRPPDLGSLVTVEGKGTDARDVYGVVYTAATRGVDPSRPVRALGRDIDSRESVHKEHPHLALLLRTDFSAIVVGHKADGRVAQYLPPTPVSIHGFVRLATDEEVRSFTASLEFLPLLLNAPVTTADAATAAFLRMAGRTQEDRSAFLLRAAKDSARLLADDGQRLNTFLLFLKG